MPISKAISHADLYMIRELNNKAPAKFTSFSFSLFGRKVQNKCSAYSREPRTVRVSKSRNLAEPITWKRHKSSQMIDNDK